MEQFTARETEILATQKDNIKYAKKVIKEVEEARREREHVANAKAAEERWAKIYAEGAAKREAEQKAADAAYKAREEAKALRDKRIRTTMEQFVNTAKSVGVKFDAPWRYGEQKKAFTVWVDGKLVQIYTTRNGFTWD